jgi:L,D-transpeptidase catalytic domain
VRLQRRQILLGLGGAAVLIGVGVAAVIALPSEGSPARARSSLPGPADPAFLVRHPPKLDGSSQPTRWAPVEEEVTARAAPDPRARPVASVRTVTPEGTRNLVEVVGRAQRRSGTLWVRARLPSGSTPSLGWLERAALGGYRFVHTRLVVDRRGLRARLLRDGRPVFSTIVGVGEPGSPTPAGRFYIRNRLARYRSPMYGPIAFGTSARSDVLTDWPAGGFVGIHGTDRPDLLPGRVSHGCIRMPNAAIRRLDRLMPVGTSVTIR